MNFTPQFSPINCNISDHNHSQSHRNNHNFNDCDYDNDNDNDGGAPSKQVHGRDRVRRPSLSSSSILFQHHHHHQQQQQQQQQQQKEQQQQEHQQDENFEESRSIGSHKRINNNDNNEIGIYNDIDNHDTEAGVEVDAEVEVDADENQESEEERRLREEEESEALVRQLMAEEAMANYQYSSNYLQENESEYNDEDLNAIRLLMAEENPETQLQMQMQQAEEEELMDSDELSYDALLNLGERIGDVKSERWAMRAENEIAKLQTFKFKPHMCAGKDPNDSKSKCLVCQFAYEKNEDIRVLPCGHYFHMECVDQWLMNKDFCPYCRQCIVDVWSVIY